MCSLTQTSANPSASAWMAKRRIRAGVARSPACGRWMPKFVVVVPDVNGAQGRGNCRRRNGGLGKPTVA